VGKGIRTAVSSRALRALACRRTQDGESSSAALSRHLYTRWQGRKGWAKCGQTHSRRARGLQTQMQAHAADAMRVAQQRGKPRKREKV
jgi:copper oxidase (laccase) domain-containing protein